VVEDAILVAMADDELLVDDELAVDDGALALPSVWAAGLLIEVH